MKLIGEDGSETVKLVHARDTFLQKLSWEELQLLRRSVREAKYRNAPRSLQALITDGECDRMIEAMGPRAAEARIKAVVDSRANNDLHRREFSI